MLPCTHHLHTLPCMKPCFRIGFGRLGVFSVFVSLLFVLATTLDSRGALQATATFTDTVDPVAGYDYTLTLNNTGTTTIGTFWFAWIPGQDYMLHSPTNIQSPAGWVALITGGGGSDGYAIQWKNSTGALLGAGSTTSTFTFTSLDTPAQMAGNSSFFPAKPVGTSYVYSGAPFSDSGFQFVVTPQATPEPSALALLVVGALGLSLVSLRRRAAASVI